VKGRTARGLILALAAGCELTTTDDLPLLQAVSPCWANQQRRPTSSHLRAVRFLDGNTGYVAGEDTSLFRTADGGNTWLQLEHQPRSRGGDIAAMDVFTSPGTVQVGTAGADAVSGGRWWTSGDGIDFSTPDTSSTGFEAMTSMDLVAYGTAYYLAADGGVRYVTPSEVTSFSVGAAGTWLALAFQGTTGTGYVAGSGGVIRKTTTNGASWTAQTSGTEILRDLCLVSANVVYACGDAGTVLKTTDGTGWSDVPVGSAVTLRGIHFVDALTGWVVGDGGFIRRTSDGGTSWGAPSAVPTSRDLHDVWFVSASVGYAVGDYGTVIRTADGGDHWTEVSGGSLDRLNAVDFTADGKKGLAVGNGGAILRTVDGGSSWGPSPSGVTADLLGLSVPDTGSGNVAYACGTGGTILKTSDFGGSWTPMASGVGVTLRAILFPAGDTYGFCVGDGSTVLHTSTGTSWSAQSSPVAADFHAVAAPFTGLTAYAAGTGGTVIYTELGGALWEGRSAGASTTLHSLQSPMGSTVYAAAEDGKIYRSFLSGQTGSWQALTPPAAPLGLVFTGPGVGWFVGDGIFATQDSGAVWTPSYEHTKWTLHAAWMGSNSVGYAVGDNGTVLKTLTAGR